VVLKDPRNLADIAVECHGGHHQGAKRLPAYKLPESVFEFACELFDGPGGAYAYLGPLLRGPRPAAGGSAGPLKCPTLPGESSYEGSNLGMVGMTALAQQELLEAPPARRIIVPAGCTAWWGVDGSTLAVAIATVSCEADTVVRYVRTAPFPRVSGPSRLREVYDATRSLAARMALREPPGLILVEQPSGSGQQVNHELEYAVGVIQAAVLDGVWSTLGHGAQMETVVSSWWKSKGTGKGNAYKTEKLPGGRKRKLGLEEYHVMRWARLNGYQGSSWDEADAMGIAEAGRRDCELVPR
jgi:hypothetical protein